MSLVVSIDPIFNVDRRAASDIKPVQKLYTS